MSGTGKNDTNATLIKIVYFDEESASDLLDIVAGGKETSSKELTKERADIGIEAIALYYGDNTTEATEYAREIETAVGIKPHLIPISPVLCAHTGPDILGICTVTKE